MQRDQGAAQDAILRAAFDLGEALPFLGSEGGDVDQADDVPGSGGGVGDHRTAVGVADDQHRAAHLVEEAGEVGGVTGEATQWIGRGRHLHPCFLQPLNHARPAGRISKSAMHEYDGQRPSSAGGCLRHKRSFLR